jgi:AcrR family transcriptional regulator
MQRIADSSRVNKAMIYYFFPSKKTIYEEVLRTVIRTVISELNAIKDDPPDVRKMLSAIIDIYQGVFLKYPDYIKLLQYELATGGETLIRMGLFKMPDLPFSPKSGHIYAYFDRKMREKVIRKMNVFQLIISIISLVVLPFMAEPLYRAFTKDIPQTKNRSFKKVLDNRKTYILDLLCEGILIRK